MNLHKQNEIFENHRKILNWEPVEKLPLVVTFPYPKSQKTQPFPHSEVFDNQGKMLFNELVHAFDTSIFLNSELGDDLPFTMMIRKGIYIVALTDLVHMCYFPKITGKHGK